MEQTGITRVLYKLVRSIVHRILRSVDETLVSERLVVVVELSKHVARATAHLKVETSHAVVRRPAGRQAGHANTNR